MIHERKASHHPGLVFRWTLIVDVRDSDFYQRPCRMDEPAGYSSGGTARTRLVGRAADRARWPVLLSVQAGKSHLIEA